MVVIIITGCEDDSVAPGLQAARDALAKERLADTLEKKIENRPTKEDLTQHNILKDTNVAPALQAAQQALEKEKLANTLEKKIENRPEQQDLIDHNILKGLRITLGCTHT